MSIQGHIRHGFINDQLPPMGTKVELLCSKNDTSIELALLCAWSEEGWIIAGTKRRIEHDVIGWRRARRERGIK